MYAYSQKNPKTFRSFDVLIDVFFGKDSCITIMHFPLKKKKKDGLDFRFIISKVVMLRSFVWNSRILYSSMQSLHLSLCLRCGEKYVVVLE